MVKHLLLYKNFRGCEPIHTNSKSFYLENFQIYGMFTESSKFIYMKLHKVHSYNSSTNAQITAVEKHAIPTEERVTQSAVSTAG